LRNNVNIKRNSICDLAFFINKKTNSVIKNKTEKLPKKALSSPVSVCLNGAI
jgi:hypothetical protein